MKAERGFTLLELTVAIVLAVALGFAMLGIVRGLAAMTAAAPTARNGTATLEALANDMRDDATVAFAVFVPESDVMHAPNVRDGNAHEVDFFSRTDSGASVYWAYYYDAAARTLRRYDYDREGEIGEANRTTGAIDATATYPPLTGVTQFDARTLQANQLTDPASAYGAVLAPAFAAATPKPLPVGFVDGEVPRPDLFGGNTTVQIRVTTTHGARTLHLASTTHPSGFTVRARPQIRAVVYRIDQTHRFWFGLAGKSHVFINARLSISYDGWKTAPQTWCAFNLYGYPAGLTGGEAENYHPEWFTESTAGIVYAVTHGSTPGASCPTVPPPNATAAAASTAFSPAPSVVDTAPPT